MFEAVCMMGGLGLIVGAGLAAASKIFYVYVDPLILAVDDVLPGANCGGCGKPGCTANAEAIVAGEAAPNSCVAAGPEVAEAIAAIMGVSVEAKEPDIAKTGCTYSVDRADTKFVYDGLSDCKAAAMLSGGMKVCSIGCLGLGSCIKACPFDAISMGPYGLPVVDEKLCTGCGTCERVCPKNIIKLSSVTRRILREYTTEDCTTPCQRACPAGINISAYVGHIAKKNYHEAVQVIKERNPFPTIIGRICPRPCEDSCRRQLVDEPVAINFLKRFAADYEKEAGTRILPFKAPDTGKKIAVIGGGVEGLSTSFFAARLGHEPTIFEAGSKLGGILRTAIAKYRLSDEILDWDIEGVMEMGVNAETEKILGKDFTIASILKDGFDSVFIATGGWDSRLSRGSESDIEQQIPGAFLLLDFINKAKENSGRITCSSDVVIVGGGSIAVDAAMACKNMGAKNITIIFRETRDKVQIENEDIENASGDGITIKFNSAMGKIYGQENELCEIECIDLKNRSTNRITVKTLIFASGRFPELVFMKTGADSGSDDSSEKAYDGKWEGFETYKRPALSSEAGLFAKGDVITDYGAAIKAIAAGRRAAASIHKAMYNIPLSLPENVLTPETFVQNVYHLENVEPMPRKIMPVCSSQDLEDCSDIEIGFDEETAVKEAERCLQCGLICYRQS